MKNIKNVIVLNTFLETIPKTMRIKRIISSLLFFSLLSFVLNGQEIKQGLLDLSLYQLNKSSIKLEGDVEFYWEQLLAPNDFINPEKELTPVYVKIPKSWSSYTIDGEKLPSNGYGTFRFRVKVNKSQSDKVFGLKVPTIFTAYKIWVNGDIVAEAGKVGKTKKMHEPGMFISEIPFSIKKSIEDSSEIDVIIQVSNFSHRRAGLPWPIYFGSFDVIKEQSRDLDILNLIVIGIILVIGLNHLNMYVFRRKDVSNLYFGILSLVMILRNITTGDRILWYIFPSINWEFLLKLDNFSGYGTIPFFALFIYHLYKKDFKEWLKNLMVGLGIAISAIIFILPASIYGKINILFELYLVFFGLYLTFGILLVAAIRKREGAFLTFIGMFLLYGTAINDVLSSMGVVQTPYVASYGLVTFMLIQSFTLNSKSASALNQNEDLSHQLAMEKEGLEQKIEERTLELRAQHDKLIEHQEKDKLQQWINKGLSKVNHVLTANKNDFSVLSRKVLTTIVKYMGIKIGALYVINDEDSNMYLERVAQYGLSKEILDKFEKIEPGSGLVGSTFTDNHFQVINSIPEKYFEINSGLGSARPDTLLLAPLATDEAIFGVLELAKYGDFKTEELEFIKKITFSIASTLNTVRMNDKNLQLIQQFQEQAQEIYEKEEKMRESLHELEFYREQYEKIKKELDELNNK